MKSVRLHIVYHVLKPVFYYYKRFRNTGAQRGAIARCVSLHDLVDLKYNFPNSITSLYNVKLYQVP